MERQGVHGVLIIRLDTSYLVKRAYTHIPCHFGSATVISIIIAFDSLS